MDENFHTLAGRDIKSVTVDGDDIVITLLNGDQVSAINALNGRVRDVHASFDVTSGVLSLEVDGEKQEIDGFTTEYTSSGLVATDGSVTGNGKASNPLSISPTAKTGQYKPVNSFIDMTKNQQLPKCKHIVPGDRFLTCENESDYGYLYNYEGVGRIATALYESNSPWRIPSKEDWDEMLNAIEPCPDFKNHDSAVCNKHLGRFAGAFLKSTDKWRGIGAPCRYPHPCENSYEPDYYAPEDEPYLCDEPYCGEERPLHPHRHHHDAHHPHTSGLDKYGMCIMPAGYVDDGNSTNYFGERAWYWASTPCNNGRSVYTKRFEHDKSSVYQDITPTTFSLSLRLVKDYDGSNYNAKEDILGQSYPTVLLPSVKHGSSIWTSVNVSLGNRSFNPIMPNNGANLTSTKKFYINEWTGQEWVRNQVLDGESVVIKRAPNGCRNIEYRLVGDELFNAAEFVYHDVMENINPQIESLDRRINAESATARENEHRIKTALDDETARSTAADEIHDNRLAALEQEADTATERLDGVDEHLATVDGRLDAVDENLEGLHAQVDAVAEDLENTKQDLADESDARQKQDQEIIERCEAIEAQHAADVVVTDEKFVEVENEISAEAEARLQADEQLDARCDALDEKIDEKSEELQGNIDAVDAKVEELTQTVADNKQASEDADAAINQHLDEVEATVPVEEGSSYDNATGELFLKSKGGTNDITVQLGFNFGTI